MNPASSNTSSADPEIQRQYPERQAAQQQQNAQGPRLVQRNTQQQDEARDVMHIADDKTQPLPSQVEKGSDMRVVVRSDTPTVAPLTVMPAVIITREVINNAIRSNDLETLRRLLQSGPIDLDGVDEVHNLPLAEAARCGNYGAVRLLLNAGADVNAGKTWQSTALVQAVENGQADIFMLLLESGADIDAISDQGDTLLMHAAGGGNVKIVEALLRLKGNADVNRGNSNCITPLMLAAKKGHAAVFSSLVRAGADIQSKNFMGDTVLMYAARGGNTAIINQLLASGAKVNMTDLSQQTALTAAVMNGHINVVLQLIEAGASIKSEDNFISSYMMLYRAVVSGGNVSIARHLLNLGLPIISSSNDSMLGLAASQGELNLVSLFLKQNPEIIDSIDWTGRTALMRAASGGHPDIFEFLLEKNANINITNKYGETLLMAASCGGNLKIINRLLSLGSDIHVKTTSGMTALMIAAEHGNDEAFMRLLDEKSAISAAEKSSNRLLQYAVKAGSAAIVKTLVSLGADINVTDTMGCTPLAVAASEGHAEVFTCLIEAGAAIDVVDTLGRTILTHAINGGNTSIVKQLLRFDIDVNAADMFGLSPLILAAMNSRPVITELLLKNGAHINVRSSSPPLFTSTDIAIKNNNMPLLELLLAYGGEPLDDEPAPLPLVSDMLQHRALWKSEMVAIKPALESFYGTSLSLLPEISPDYSVRKSLAAIFEGLQICSPITGRVNDLLGTRSIDQSPDLSDDYLFSDAASGDLSDDHPFSDADSGELSDDQSDAPDKLMQALAGAGGPLKHEQKSMVIAGVLASLDAWVKSRPKGWSPYRRQGLSAAGEKKLTALVKLQAQKLAALGERAEGKLAAGLNTLLPKCAQYTQVKNDELVVDESRLVAYLTTALGLYGQLASLVAAAWVRAVKKQQEAILSSSLFRSPFDDQASKSEAGLAVVTAFRQALAQINSAEGRSQLRASTLEGQRANLYSDLVFRQLDRLMQYVKQASTPEKSTN